VDSVVSLVIRVVVTFVMMASALELILTACLTIVSPSGSNNFVNVFDPSSFSCDGGVRV